MIDKKEIKDALETRIENEWTGPAVSFAYPGFENIPDRPYIALDITHVSQNDATLDGTAPIVVQFLTATVVCERGRGQRLAPDYINEVKRLFPYGTRLSITGAEITITKHPDDETGYPDGFDWRIPVRIDYRVEK